MGELLLGEAVHFVELILLQLRRLLPYWLAGILVGSIVSVFLSPLISAAAAAITGPAARVGRGRPAAVPACAVAAVLGAASPVCMYGTVPLIASLGRRGVPQHVLASFMISSILINPNLFVFSLALGAPLAFLRLGACVVAGIIAGLALKLFMKEGMLFKFNGFEEPGDRAAAPGDRAAAPGARALAASLGRGLTKTAPYFLGGLALTALVDRYFPRQLAEAAFGQATGLGPLVAASIGVPVYMCGGGTIPLLKAWLDSGMSTGSALAFCISGPATKLTNLGAVKIILGARNFVLYLVYTISFAVLSGLAIDAIVGITR